jgi:hypothetical protein
MLFTSANQLTLMNMPEWRCQEVVVHPAIVTVMNWTVSPVMVQDQCDEVLRDLSR